MEISKSYADQLKQMHSGQGKKIGYGIEPPKKLVEIISKYSPKTILDYGCGSGAMMRTISKIYPNIKMLGYDPGVEQYSQFPGTVDLIYSTDVLEHIEPVALETTLKKLWNTSEIHYHNIACHPAKKNLPDGRNCHLIIESPDWWLEKIKNTTTSDWTVEYKNIKYSQRKNRQGIHFEIVLVKK